MGKKDISPSSLAKRLLCPGSYAAERDLPELSSAWSEYGTAMHKCFERLATGPELAHEYVKEMDMADAKDIHEAIDWTAALMRDNVGDKQFKAKAEYLTNLKFMGAKELTEGTIDLLLYENFGEAQIYDWKFGNPKVSGDILEWQQKAYALGAMQEFGLTRVKCFTVFPMCKFVRNFEFVALERDTYIQQILEVEGRTMMEGAPRVAGAYQCSRCKAMGTCPMVDRSLKTIATCNTSKVVRFGDLIRHAMNAKEIAPYVLQRAEEHLAGGGKIEGWTLGVEETRRWKRGCKEEVVKLINQKIISIIGNSYIKHFIIGSSPKNPDTVISYMDSFLPARESTSIHKMLLPYIVVSKKQKLKQEIRKIQYGATLKETGTVVSFSEPPVALEDVFTEPIAVDEEDESDDAE